MISSMQTTTMLINRIKMPLMMTLALFVPRVKEHLRLSHAPRVRKGSHDEVIWQDMVCKLPSGDARLLTFAERIHSGVRPHACDFDGCGKRFIQRSALTVHQRVHTGHKPHMCERCGKVSIHILIPYAHH